MARESLFSGSSAGFMVGVVVDAVVLLWAVDFGIRFVCLAGSRLMRTLEINVIYYRQPLTPVVLPGESWVRLIAPCLCSR